MGCDLHLYAERRWTHGGKWEFQMEHSAHRNYRLFGRLAGVRDLTTVPIVEPRGYPPDITEHVGEEAKWWGPDAHTPSWLTLDEADSARGIADDFDAFVAYLRTTNQHFDTRLVFWFDN